MWKEIGFFFLCWAEDKLRDLAAAVNQFDNFSMSVVLAGEALMLGETSFLILLR